MRGILGGRIRSLFTICILAGAVCAPHESFCQTVPFTSSNLPIAVIRTGGATIVDDPKVMVDLGIIDNGPGARNNISDPYNHYNAKAGIEIRGSSSQMFPKKQYGVELWDAHGNDLDHPMLGLPEEADWIFFAPYNDKSLMRDALAYRLGRTMGRYSSRSRYFELVIDDQYQGIYLLLEKVKRGKDRVPIDKLEPDETSGDESTGGYIIKIDKATGSGGGAGFESPYPPPHRSANQTVFFQYEYPGPEDISQSQKAYIARFMKEFEDVLYGPKYADPSTGYEKYIDIASFVDFFILNEVSKNPDGYRLSTFLHKEKDSDGGKLSMGPFWDFNLGFGNVDYCTKSDTQGLVIDFNTICPGDFWLIPFWWQKLWNDSGFRMKVAARWQSLRETHFATATVHSYIDSVATVLTQESAPRNFQRWPVLGQYVWPNSFVGSTYDQELTFLKNWVASRFDWLDTRFAYEISGIEDLAARVTAYPNPATSGLTFRYQLREGGTTSFQLFDALGRTVGHHNESNDAGEHDTTVPIANLSPGPYFYRIVHNNQSIGSGSVVKQ
jgi:hypothetical protein